MQDFGQTAVDAQLLLDDGHEHVNADGDPDLGLHRVLGGAVKRLDAQVLLDPLEEQLHLPAALVQLRDSQGWKKEVIGEEDQPVLRLGVEVADAAQSIGVVF